MDSWQVRKFSLSRLQATDEEYESAVVKTKIVNVIICDNNGISFAVFVFRC